MYNNYTICTNGVVRAGVSHRFHQVVSCKIHQHPRRKMKKIQAMALGRVWGPLFGHFGAPQHLGNRQEKGGGGGGKAAADEGTP
jgi:hypothetical protein